MNKVEEELQKRWDKIRAEVLKRLCIKKGEKDENHNGR